MKGGIKDGNMLERGQGFSSRPNASEIRRIVKRGERHAGFDGGNDGVIDEHGIKKVGSTVDDPVTDRCDLEVFERRQNASQRLGVTTGELADTFHLARAQAAASGGVYDLVLDTRGSTVDD
jgi:chloramphenicol 3-O-phosphotransferase